MAHTQRDPEVQRDVDEKRIVLDRNAVLVKELAAVERAVRERKRAGR